MVYLYCPSPAENLKRICDSTQSLIVNFQVGASNQVPALSLTLQAQRLQPSTAPSHKSCCSVEHSPKGTEVPLKQVSVKQHCTVLSDLVVLSDLICLSFLSHLFSQPLPVAVGLLWDVKISLVGGSILRAFKLRSLLPTISFHILENHMAPVSTFYAPVFPKPKLSGT